MRNVYKNLCRNVAAVLLAALISSTLPIYINSAENGKTDDFSASTIAHSIVLNGNIGIKFYLSISDSVIQSGGAYVLMNVKDRYTIKVHLDEAAPETILINGINTECYVFEYDVAITQITLPVTIKVCLKNGSAVYTDTYSVYEYASKVLDGTYTDREKPEELRALIRAMLNFGGYAQQYFGYELSAAANDGLYTPDNDPVTNDDFTLDTSQNYLLKSPGFPESIQLVSSALKLDSDTGICLYFRTSDGYDISDFTFTYNKNILKPVYDEALCAYRITISGIAAPDLSNFHALLIKPADSSASYYISYCPFHYIDTAINKSTNESLRSTVKALYFYYQAAQAYFTE